MSLWWRRSAPATERRGPEIAGWPDPATYWATYDQVDAAHGQTSLQSVAVGSTVELICSLVSELPVDVYSGSGASKRPRQTPGYLQDPGGDGYGVQDWTSQYLASQLLRGNAYGNVLARAPGGGFPTQITWFPPDAVGGWIDSGGNVQWQIGGKPVTNETDFLHHRINPAPGQVLGLSPVAKHAATIGLNITVTRFGSQWFRDGAHPGGMLTNSEAELTGDQAKTAKERFLAALRGTREPVVLGKGWSYQQIQVAPEESQFLETSKFTAAECARIFGPGFAEILGYETGGSLTYVTVEGKSTHLLVYSMNKWINRVERLLTSMLPRPQYVKLNRAALLQTTTLDRYNAHKIATGGRGWSTVNEVRDIEDQAPVDWGDDPSPAIGAAPAVGDSQQQDQGAKP